MFLGYQEISLQRFSSSSFGFTHTDDGPIVYAQSPCFGQRRGAIVVRAKLADTVQPSSSFSWGWSCSIDLNWHNWKIRFVSAHLSPGKSFESYCTSVEDIEQLCDFSKSRRYVVTGAM